MANNVTLSSLSAALNQLSNALSAPAQQNTAGTTGGMPVAAAAIPAATSSAADQVFLGAGHSAPLTYNAKGLLNQSSTLQALLSQGGDSMLQAVLGQTSDGTDGAGNLASDLMTASSTVDMAQLNLHLQQALAARNKADSTGAQTTAANNGSATPTDTTQTPSTAANNTASSALARAIQQNPALLNQLTQQTATQGLIDILG